MKLKLFSVYDSKVGSFAQPFFLHTRGEALRGWIDVSNDEKTAIGLHPEDYTLFELGEYDDQSGTVINNTTPISLGLALEFNQKSKNAYQEALNGTDRQNNNSNHNTVPRVDLRDNGDKELQHHV